MTQHPGLILKLALTLAALGALGLAIIRVWFFFPPLQQQVEVHCPEAAQPIPIDRPLKVLVWNIQFGASRNNHFFYDGGDVVSVSADDVEHTMAGIVQTIKGFEPDLVLLQEVDRASRRTGYLDQHALLVEQLGLSCHISTPYFKAPYVPHPSGDHLGPVEMHLSVFSRYSITEATRHQLALLDEPLYRRLFNLRRAALVATLPTDDGRVLHLVNTHLSAFSGGDGTLDRQIAQLQDIVTSMGDQPLLLAGDFNALPPGFDAAQTADADDYPETTSPIAPLFKQLTPAIKAEMLASDPNRHGTYRPFGAEQTDRTIDYLFTKNGLDVTTHGVIHTNLSLSDHEPLFSVLSFK